jgi:alkanesulfonate monooxygenase SsuD/methylene tetrahydromethanopterin reductase-like flavin-dependent oxidoreductase (luciferase family)
MFGGASPKMFQLAGKYADICLIPAWPGLDNMKARKIAQDAARHNGREEKLAFADMVMFPREGSKYDREQYRTMVEKAVSLGSKYFIVPFPFGEYMNSMKDFARNIIPSFESQRVLEA